jgi:probable rRNA maturation factor
MRTRRALSIANRHPRLRLDRRAVTRVVATLDAHAAEFRGGCPPGELSLAFLTDAALARLHGDFLADPTITDVITFAAKPDHPSLAAEEDMAGEICVSADAAGRHVKSRPATVKRKDEASPFSAELTLYIVHGWLHLAGYDDLEPAKKRVMRRAETRAMKLLRETGCMPQFTLR